MDQEIMITQLTKKKYSKHYYQIMKKNNEFSIS